MRSRLANEMEKNMIKRTRGRPLSVLQLRRRALHIHGRRRQPHPQALQLALQRALEGLELVQLGMELARGRRVGRSSSVRTACQHPQAPQSPVPGVLGGRVHTRPVPYPCARRPTPPTARRASPGVDLAAHGPPPGRHPRRWAPLRAMHASTRSGPCEYIDMGFVLRPRRHAASTLIERTTQQQGEEIHSRRVPLLPPGQVNGGGGCKLSPRRGEGGWLEASRQMPSP
jgi:hypothetical protein